MHGPPPAHVKPARLWRLLASTGDGRPAWPLSLRCAAAPQTPLHVRALRGAEVEAMLDDARDWAAPAPHYERFRVEVLAASLHTPAGRAVAHPDATGGLLADEADALADACFAALAICSPTYQRSAVAAWEAVLAEGARDPANLADAVALGACVDHGWASTTPRPDLWWGCAVGALTDGQMMAFRAARAVLRSLQSSQPGPGRAAPPPFR